MVSSKSSFTTLSPEEVAKHRSAFLAPGGYPKFCYMLQWRDEDGWDALPAFHRGMAERQDASRETMEIAPRGGGKTNIRTVCRAIYKLAQNPNARVLVGSISERKAKDFGRDIQGRLEGNQLLHVFFPELSKPKKVTSTKPWGVFNMSIEGRTQVGGIETSITIRSVDGDVVGKHFDCMLMDDMVDEKTAKSETLRERMDAWYHTSLLPCKEPGAELHISGTRYHFRDIYGTLIGDEHRPGKWYDRVVVTPAYDENGKSFWSTRFPSNEQEAQEIFDALPEYKQQLIKEPFPSLPEIKDEMGTAAFNAQMMGDVRAMKGSMFKPEWMNIYTELPPNTGLDSFMGVDLAIGQKTINDYTAIVTVVIDQKTGNIYVLSAWHGRITFHEQEQHIQARYLSTYDDPSVRGPHLVAIENIAYQDAIVQELKRKTSLPVKAITPSKDKVTRASSLSAIMENGKILFKEDHRELLDELLLFPEGDHDDLVDALVMAVDAAKSTSHKAQPMYVLPKMGF